MESNDLSKARLASPMTCRNGEMLAYLMTDEVIPLLQAGRDGILIASIT